MIKVTWQTNNLSIQVKEFTNEKRVVPFLNKLRIDYEKTKKAEMKRCSAFVLKKHGFDVLFLKVTTEKI